MKRTVEANGHDFGPIHEAAQAYFGKVKGTNVEMGQSYRGVARSQLEMWGLASRRAQAYLELPGRMSRCRTLEDVQREQMRFAQQASQQYIETTKRVVEAWQSAFLFPFASASTNSGARKSAKADAVARDFITVEEKQPVQVEKVRPRIKPRAVKTGRDLGEDRHVA